MKVHPVPRKHNIALRYEVASVLALANSCQQKKLRRLPHIYEKVLELPFHPDADVSIEKPPRSFDSSPPRMTSAVTSGTMPLRFAPELLRLS